MICPQCGAPLDDDAKFCESCGAQIEMSVSAHEEKTDASAEPMVDGSNAQEVSDNSSGYVPSCNGSSSGPSDSEQQSGSISGFCPKCGCSLLPDQMFCPKCGFRLDSATPDISNTGSDEKSKKRVARIVVPTVMVVAVAIVIIVAVVLTRSPSVESVDIVQSSLSMRLEDEDKLTYTIKPSDVADTKVTWESSDEDVATVDEEGHVFAVGEGTCTVTITAGNETDEVEIVVKNGPDFQELYDEFCISTWATVGSDDSYLLIDTNPYNEDGVGIAYYDAYLAVQNINKELGLPESVLNAMEQTTSLQGKQSETFSDIGVIVSWTYHPDDGLEVSYQLIN